MRCIHFLFVWLDFFGGDGGKDNEKWFVQGKKELFSSKCLRDGKMFVILQRFKQPPGDLIQRRGAICRCVPSVVAEMPCDAQNKGVPAKGTLLFS